MKTCSSCRKSLNANAFQKNKSSSDGLQRWCRVCMRDYYEGLRSTRAVSAPKVVVGSKRCSRCRDFKPRADFHKNASAHDGRQSICKVCGRYPARRRCDRTGSLRAADYDLIMQAADYCCGYCGQDLLALGAPPMHWDHDMPVSKGGGTTFENMVPACSPCNRSKGILSGQDFRSRVKFHAAPVLVLRSYSTIEFRAAPDQRLTPNFYFRSGFPANILIVLIDIYSSYLTLQKITRTVRSRPRRFTSHSAASRSVRNSCVLDVGVCCWCLCCVGVLVLCERSAVTYVVALALARVGGCDVCTRAHALEPPNHTSTRKNRGGFRTCRVTHHHTGGEW
jgi:5-methylcytosine-specific restriction endonuclease McrA